MISSWVAEAAWPSLRKPAHLSKRWSSRKAAGALSDHDRTVETDRALRTLGVAKLTIYVVDWGPDKMPLLGEGVSRAAEKLGIDPVKPITLLGVAALGEPDLLVEVEATAVLD